MADQMVDRRDNRKFEIDREVLEFYCKHIGGNAYVVYSFLASQATFMPSLFPSHRLISEVTGLSATTIKKCLKILAAEDGTPLREVGYPALISVTPQTRDNGAKSSNLYALENVPGQSVLSKLDVAQAESDHAHRQNLPMQEEGAGGEGGVLSGFAQTGADRAEDSHDTPTAPSVNPEVEAKKQREREINETAKGIVMAYCEASGVSHDAIEWAVEMKAAKSLARKHLTPERVKPFYVWLASQTWVTSGVTLRLMNSMSTAYLEYRRRQEKPVRNIV